MQAGTFTEETAAYVTTEWREFLSTPIDSTKPVMCGAFYEISRRNGQFIHKLVHDSVRLLEEQPEKKAETYRLVA